MSWKRKILVVANQTVGSEELRRELRERSEQGPSAVTLLLPHRPTALAADRLRLALAELREDGLEVEGRLANPDPFMAVDEAWDPALYDEILVSTLPTAKSRWLKAGLPQRIERHTGALVSVVSGRVRTATEADMSVSKRATVTASLSVTGDVITLQRTSDPKFTDADVEAVLAALSQRERAA
ncbi:MAG: hypothetical protein ACLP0J_26435 [Solirubrobacteraceae bacterium]|jgi:hypothetical protein